MVIHSSVLALENPMDRGAWQAEVPRVTQSWTCLKQLSLRVQLMRHPLVELFHLSNLLRILNNCKPQHQLWLMLSSSATSRVVVRGSVSMIALSWSLSTSSGQPPHPHLQGSPLHTFLNHHCTVHSLAVPGPNVLLML